MAEKYSPFDVDVTAVDPGAAAYTRTSAGDTTYGVQVVLTDDPRPVTAVCNDQCAGVAYNDAFDGRVTGGVFNTTPYAPAWVFTSKTVGSAQVTSIAAAHEVGHTLGLGHDGVTTVSGDNYYNGHANWTPIMGSANQRAVAQFSKGEYANANNTEDDLAIIGADGTSGAAGSMVLADDYGTTGSAPTALGDHTTYAVDGIISNAADDDLFSIARTCTSALTATATGIGSGQTLDIEVDVLDASNNVLATDNPTSGQNLTQAGDIGYLATGMDASATLASTTAGATYRVRVDGVGSGDPLSTGYSDYGSIGQYHLTISGCPVVAAAVPGTPASASATRTRAPPPAP